jgi:DNA-binding MarR family transcriptional regulator
MLSDKILRDVEETKKQAEQNREKIKDVEQDVTGIVEPEGDREQPESDTQAMKEITEDELKVLRAMAHSQFVLRTTSGIARQLGISKAGGEQHLLALIDKGFVSKIPRKKGERYILTGTGQEAIAHADGTA